MKTFLLFLTLFLCLLTFPVMASDVDFGSSRIHPASPLYFLKTIREKIELGLAQTPRVKMIRQLEFATRRLRETNSLISVGREDLVGETLIRYWSHIDSLPDKDLEDADLAQRIAENLKIDLQFLERSYPNLQDSRAQLAFRSLVNKIVQRRDVPKDARAGGCSFLATEASSSALNTTERAVLAQRADKCASMVY